MEGGKKKGGGAPCQDSLIAQRWWVTKPLASYWREREREEERFPIGKWDWKTVVRMAYCAVYRIHILRYMRGFIDVWFVFPASSSTDRRRVSWGQSLSPLSLTPSGQSRRREPSYIGEWKEESFLSLSIYPCIRAPILIMDACEEDPFTLWSLIPLSNSGISSQIIY